MKKFTLFPLIALAVLILIGFGNINRNRFNSVLMAKNSMEKEILDAHNKYRTKLKLPPLVWSDKLSVHALKWARHLAGRGGRSLSHSSNRSRPGEGENLWMGTSGYYSYKQMVDGWGSEKKYFVYGKFPKVSNTGNWADVGHYTQIIWKDTKKVGCALSKAGGNDILVCRYNPPGNYMGRPVY